MEKYFIAEDIAERGNPPMEQALQVFNVLIGGHIPMTAMWRGLDGWWSLGMADSKPLGKGLTHWFREATLIELYRKYQVLEGFKEGGTAHYHGTTTEGEHIAGTVEIKEQAKVFDPSEMASKLKQKDDATVGYGKPGKVVEMEKKPDDGILDEKGFVAKASNGAYIWVRMWGERPWMLYQETTGQWVTKKPLNQIEVWVWTESRVPDDVAAARHALDPEKVYESLVKQK